MFYLHDTISYGRPLLIAILTLFLVVILSILVTRIATIAMTYTGLSRESARFQVRSAFTGSGFTTAESEMVVRHPVRRRIVLLLMLLGNAGIVTAVSSLILTFVRQGPVGLGFTLKIVLLAAGLAALWTLASIQWVDRGLSLLIEKALKRLTSLDIHDYAGLLHLSGEYRLGELQVKQEDWLAGRDLRGAALRQEGIMVLGIERRDGTYTGTPKGHTTVLPGDILVLYGRANSIEDLDTRKKGREGDAAHRGAVQQQQEVVREETQKDETSKNQ